MTSDPAQGYTLIWTNAGTSVFSEILSLRRDVFVVEQGIPEDVEIDGNDQDALHLGAFGPVADKRTDRICATLRLTLDPHCAKLGRMAVCREVRRRGLGSRLVAEAIAEATRRDYDVVELAAQQSAQAFYDRLGFEVVSEPFAEAGILHVTMVRTL